MNTASSFATILEINRSVTIEQKNVRFLMTEMLMTTNDLELIFMTEFFFCTELSPMIGKITFLLPMMLKQSGIEESVFSTLFKGKLRI